MCSYSAVGIDLGTAYSCVGVFKHGKVEIIANDQGNRTTPTYVAFAGSEILIGESAKSQMATNPHNTVFDAKRLIGRDFTDKAVQSAIKHWPFKVISAEGGEPNILVEYKGESKIVTPVEISTMVLMEMKKTAEASLGNIVKDAVITVPAYFNNVQRQATKDAGTISKFNVLRITDEPTAVAYGYALNVLGRGKRNIIIVDLGSIAMCSYVVTVDGLSVDVKSLLKNIGRGGENLTDILMNHVMKDLNKKYFNKYWCGVDTFGRIRSACKRTIDSFCRLKESTLYVEKIRKDDNLCRTISRESFSSLIDKSLKCLREMVHKSLSESKMDISLVHDVLFVGRYSKLPMYQDVLCDIFSGKELNKSINPDHAVAYGAAVQAAILTGYKLDDIPDLLPLVVAPPSLAIETKDNNLLGKFELSGIPPETRGVLQIEVSFDTDANGILNFSVTKKQNKDTTNGMKRLTKEGIEKLVNEVRRDRITAKIALESYANKIKEITENEKLKDKVSPEDKKMMVDKCGEILKWLGSNKNAEKEEFNHQQKDLEQLANPIISKLNQRAGGAPGAAGGAGGPTIEEVD